MLRFRGWWLLVLLWGSVGSAAESTRYLVKLHSDGFLAGQGIWTAEVREGKTGLAIDVNHLLPALERAGWGVTRQYRLVVADAGTVRSTARFVSIDVIARQLGLFVKADAQRRTLTVRPCLKACGLVHIR